MYSHLTAITIHSRHLAPGSTVHHVACELDRRNEVAARSIAGAVDVLGGVVILHESLAQQSSLDPLSQATKSQADGNRWSGICAVPLVMSDVRRQ